MNADRRGRGWRTATLAAAMAGIALLVAACGGGSPAVAGQTAYQKDLAYSQCMRGHGEPGFPDPQPNGAILITAKDHLAQGSPQFAAANKACQHLLPNGGVMTAAQKQQALDRLLKFTACMRAHGITNFPDPTVTNGGVGLSVGGPGGPNPHSPQFQSAQHACRKFMPGIASGGP
jgi:hypothetical protein